MTGLAPDDNPSNEDAKLWWQGAVIYQIYPRSFLDTSGNGVGDLQGIRRKLDYIRDLGVDALWISPFVESPMRDFGYDVSNYLKVDPLFGSGEDFHQLIEEAHERGLRVLMDQVLSHTSSEHPWFIESRSSRNNEKADWYVWADPLEDGSPPNNWLSVFGGSSWQWEPRREQYYLHNFLREQPDLNYHEPAVRGAVLDVCRHWLDMGVDGFRLDVCAFYFHDAQLRDNPPNQNRSSGSSFVFNPYSMQHHVRDIGQPENLDFLARLRTLCDRYKGSVLLGELHESEAEALHRAYTTADRLHLAYGYWLLGADHINARLVRDAVHALGFELGDGWPCWALENHDFERAPSRLGDRQLMLTLTAALSCLRGASCLYQGGELGLPQGEVPQERVIDPYGREFWPAYKGRDGARTPMPWSGAARHMGFSRAERTWLPVCANHRSLAVDEQDRTPGSTLNRVRHFLHWRKGRTALRRGSMRLPEVPDPLLAIERSLDTERVLCIFNLGEDQAVLNESTLDLGKPLEGHGFDWAHARGLLTLPPGGAYFGELV